MDKVNEFEYGADIHYSNDVNTNYVKFSVDSNLHYRFSSAEDLLNDLDTLAAMIKHHHGFESIPRTRFVRIFSRFQRVSISSFRPAVKPKPFDR